MTAHIANFSFKAQTDLHVAGGQRQVAQVMGRKTRGPVLIRAQRFCGCAALLRGCGRAAMLRGCLAAGGVCISCLRSLRRLRNQTWDTVSPSSHLTLYRGAQCRWWRVLQHDYWQLLSAPISMASPSGSSFHAQPELISRQSCHARTLLSRYAIDAA